MVENPSAMIIDLSLSILSLFIKKMLFLDNGSYNQFYEFNRSVLKPSIKEINEISDIKISLNIKKEGRRVVYISFFVEKKENNIKTQTFEEDLKEAENIYLERKDQKNKKSSILQNQQKTSIIIKRMLEY